MLPFIMWKTWHSILCWLAVPGLAFVAWLFQGYGFDVLQQMRQLERVPRSQIISVIEGEVNLEGKASSLGSSLRAPHTGTECLYYLYILEEEREDSDGDSYWAEIRRESERVDVFLFRDESSEIEVLPAGAEINVESHSFVVGDYRHTEFRLHPNDEVFVFGYAGKDLKQNRIGFETEGLYTPIISTFGEKDERRDMASASLLWSFGALAAASFAVMFCCWGLKVHRLLVFLTIVSLVQGVGLVYLGLTMLRYDLESSRARALTHQQRAKEEIQTLLDRGGVRWDGDWSDAEVFAARGGVNRLPAEDAARVRGIYGDTAAGIARFNAVRARFPERMLASGWGVAPLAEMRQAKSFASGFDQQKTIEKVPIGFWTFLLMAGLGGLAACGFSLWGFRKIKEKRYIENIPTSLSTGLAYGPAEIKGKAVKDAESYNGPLSGEDCLYYHYVVQEKRGSGKNESWVTIVDEKVHARFLCRDDEGETPVDLDDAEIHSRHVHTKSEYRRIYTETNLRPGDDLYILGPAIIDPSTGDRLRIAADDSDFPLIVANLTEKEMMTRKGRRGLGLLNVGLNGFVVMGLAGFGITASYAPTDYLLAAFIAPVFLALCFIVLMFNDLQFVRHRVRRAWANIDVSLKKRADLLPSLEAIAKEYLAHERSVHEGIATMRASLDGSLDPAGADELLLAEKSVTSRLLAVQEDYPDLKGSLVIQQLADQVVTLENEVALMRAGYNDSVERHNTRIQRLPEVIIAKLFGYPAAEPLQTELTIRRATPEVAM